MKITNRTRIMDLIKEYPFLEDFIIDKYPDLKLIKNKILRKTIGKKAILEDVSDLIKENINDLIAVISAKIKSETGEEVESSESKEVHRDKSILKLKEIIKELHKSDNKEKAKADFNNLLKSVDPEQIVAMEQMLIQEGTDVFSIQKLCDTHLEIMQSGLSQDLLKDLPEGHPVDIYIKENAEISKKTNELNRKIVSLTEGSPEEAWEDLKETIKQFRAIEFHYTRKENQLFPFLEKRGITGPPQVMWGIHDEIRKNIKDIAHSTERKNLDDLKNISSQMIRKIIETIKKEELILFPMALETLTEEEWYDIKKGEPEIGFAFLNEIKDWKPEKSLYSNDKPPVSSNEFNLTTGTLNTNELDKILLTMPVDISYVDKNDNVKYYSGSKERIFPRSPGVIGRNVENCHPPASVDKVKQILDAFKRGEKNVAEFWIELQGKFLHIRYFAVRDDDGSYMGTLEFMQDVTSIRNLKGERRLLNWE
ncbi:MAG: DUF438 domain-containing protein [Candidatus Aminicenantes bacterium]|nr:DUF438 domain-containing protein [Candidatus Aminicenantes bacterium]